MPVNFKATTRNVVALLFICLSLACLYPGLTLPVLELKISARLPLLGDILMYEQKQSIVESIRSLLESKNTLVAYLIFLFSIAVPVLKALLLIGIIAFPYHKAAKNIARFISAIGKWSMADVFVVGVFMAFLAGQANSNIEASLHNGFYYFTAYCVLSIIAMQFYKAVDKQ